MPRLCAFLRAVNVGGRRVRMDRLRQVCEGFGLHDVLTLQAAGNVLFTTRRRNLETLRVELEAHLERELGFFADVFLRSDAELRAIAAHPGRECVAWNIALLHEPLDAAGLRALDGLRTRVDVFEAVGRDVHWYCAVKQSESELSNAAFEKALGLRATVRNVRTVRGLVGMI